VWSDCSSVCGAHAGRCWVRLTLQSHLRRFSGKPEPCQRNVSSPALSSVSVPCTLVGRNLLLNMPSVWYSTRSDQVEAESRSYVMLGSSLTPVSHIARVEATTNHLPISLSTMSTPPISGNEASFDRALYQLRSISWNSGCWMAWAPSTQSSDAGHITLG
jgi:hypothetical protein